MAITLQIGTFQLSQANNVLISQIDADSSTPLNPQIFDTANRDGGKMIAAFFKPKKITIHGRVTGVDYATTNQNLDALKLALTGMNMNLDINDGTTCKRYIVTNANEIVIPRAREHLTFADWAVTYICVDPPFALDVTQGGAVNVFSALSASNVTVDIFTSTLLFSGSAQPGTKLTVSITNPGDLYALDIVDIQNSRSMNIQYSFQTGDVLVVDLVNYVVQVNGIDINYSGQFPNWQAVAGQQIGINGYTVSGINLDQTSLNVGAPTATNSSQLLYSPATALAQQFTPIVTSPVSRVALILNKVGNPSGNVIITIQSDTSGSPSGTILTSYSVAASSISGVFNYINASFSTQPNLTAGNPYWIVVNTDTTGDVNNFFNVRTISPTTYSGLLRKTTTSGASWNTIAGTCFAFKEFRSVAGQQNPSSDFVVAPYVENFSSTTKKDPTNTTANWDTSVSRLHMNGVNTVSTGVVSTDGITSAYMVLGNGGNVYGYFFPYIATNTGTLQTITLTLKRQNPSATYITVSLSSSAPSGSGLPYIGTVDSHLQQASMTTTFAPYNFTVNAPITAGATYYVVITYPDNGGGITNGMFMRGGTGSYNLTSVDSTGAPKNVTSSQAVDASYAVQYLIYNAQEQGQSTELAATNADILSVSQVTNTVLLSGATYYGQFSVDGGTTWPAMARDTNPFDTDNIPPTAGNTLKMRWLLQNNVTLTQSPYIVGTNLYWKKGISVEAATTYATESFVPTVGGTISTLQLFIAAYGAPGTTTAYIQTDASGVPSGTIVTNGTSGSGSAASASFGWISFSFATPVTVVAGTKYWIVFKVTAGTINSANRYLLLANNNGYASGVMLKTLNSGTTWTGFASAEDLLFRTYGSGGGNYNLNVQVTYNKRYL